MIFGRKFLPRVLASYGRLTLNNVKRHNGTAQTFTTEAPARNELPSGKNIELPDGIEREELINQIKKEGHGFMLRAFLIEASRISIGTNQTKKPLFYNMHHYRRTPFSNTICTNENDKVILAQIKEKTREHDGMEVKFPMEIFGVNCSDLVDPTKSTVQDFPLPRSIRRQIDRRNNLYQARDLPYGMVRGVEIRIAGRSTGRRKRVHYYAAGKFNRSDLNSKIDQIGRAHV